MRIANYQGKSGISLAIRWLTRSRWSHSAFVFDDAAQAAAIRLSKMPGGFKKLTHISFGSVVEAWHKPNGVQNSPSISTLHSPGTRVDFFDFVSPLTALQEEQLLRLLDGDIGDRYGFLNVLKFVTRRPGNFDNSWFCSELVHARCRDVDRMLLRAESWAVPPAWIPMSPLIRPSGWCFTA